MSGLRLLTPVLTVAALSAFAPTAHAATERLGADAYGLTADRLVAMTSAFVALAGVIVGVRALARPGGRLVAGRRGAAITLVAGLVGVLVGAWIVGTADGGLGTGNGIAGGYLAIALGLGSLASGGLVLRRARAAR
ncbi:DUF6223 family protein [Nocardia thailandica]